MSTSSKPKNRAPAHQNRTAFRHNKNSKHTKHIAETATTFGLCPKCTEKQRWRVKYRKYKPLTVPRKCNKCGKKSVKAAYRTICGTCATTLRVCSSCEKPRAGRDEDDDDDEEDGVGSKVILGHDIAQQEDISVREVLNGLTERQRRTAYRRIDRGEDPVEVAAALGGLDMDDDDSEGDANTDDGDDPDGSGSE